MSKRPSVSMRPQYFRALCWIAEETDASRCAAVERAIEDLAEKLGLRPPEGWEPEARLGRPPIDRVSEAAEKHFTF